MSSDGEYDEGPYSSQSQEPEYADEVAEELKDLVEDDSQDPDYDPDSPVPSEEEAESEESEDSTSEETVYAWDRKVLGGLDPLFSQLVEAQPIPQCSAICTQISRFELFAKSRSDIPAEVRKHIVRLAALSRDFWEHASEELSDHMCDSIRLMKKLDARLKKRV